jgi:hypothetical protein
VGYKGIGEQARRNDSFPQRRRQGKRVYRLDPDSALNPDNTATPGHKRGTPKSGAFDCYVPEWDAIEKADCDVSGKRLLTKE